MSSAFVNALSRAEDMASRTGRADHADTVARLYHILFDLAAVGASEDRQAAWYQHKHDIVGTLLIKLEGCISSSDKAFHTALRNTPLHGHLCALRSVQGQPSLSHIAGAPDFHKLVSYPSEMQTSAWRSFHERIDTVCGRIWTMVTPTLCVDSPECEQDIPNENVIGPKDLLSCSWRALRESR
jgi:hypothetical protein